MSNNNPPQHDFGGVEPGDFTHKGIKSMEKKREPPRILLYGPKGIGKTTWPSKAPKPIYIPTEDGLADHKLSGKVSWFPLVRSWLDMQKALSTLTAQPDPLIYETVVIDGLTKFEPMLWAHTCSRWNPPQTEIDNEGAFGYQRGYLNALDDWREILESLDALRARGVIVVLLCHSALVEVKNAITGPYDQYAPRLQKHARDLVCDWVDVVAYADMRPPTVITETTDFEKKARRGVGTGERILYTTGTAAVKAGNRYSLPALLPLDWNAFDAHLNPAKKTKKKEAVSG